MAAPRCRKLRRALSDRKKDDRNVRWPTFTMLDIARTTADNLLSGVLSVDR